MEFFEKINYCLLNDKKPSYYFEEMLKSDNFPKCYPYNILIKLTDIEQNKQHHPEGNVWNHTMQVVDYAAKMKEYSENEQVFMWAALLHDIGKIPTTKVRKGKITSYSHDIEGEKLAREFLISINNDNLFIEKVSKLVRWHMQPLFVLKDLPFADVLGMVKDTSVCEVGLLSLCDRIARGHLSISEKNNVNNIIVQFLLKCKEFVENENELVRINDTINILKNLQRI